MKRYSQEMFLQSESGYCMPYSAEECLLRLLSGQMEQLKLISFRAMPDTDLNNSVQQVKRRNAKAAFFLTEECLERFIPGACRNGDPGREIHHHLPGDRHHIVTGSVICRYQQHRA